MFFQSILSMPYSSLPQDNHDAEAFLKPVSRSDYPDYYESAPSYSQKLKHS